VPEEDREPVLALKSGAYEKLLRGGKVCGLRVTLRKARKPQVTDLLNKAWMHKAPKTLVAKLREST
jgi:hypothetical protein